jgi:hypothetical protein
MELIRKNDSVLAAAARATVTASPGMAELFDAAFLTRRKRSLVSALTRRLAANSSRRSAAARNGWEDHGWWGARTSAGSKFKTCIKS